MSTSKSLSSPEPLNFVRESSTSRESIESSMMLDEEPAMVPESPSSSIAEQRSTEASDWEGYSTPAGSATDLTTTSGIETTPRVVGGTVEDSCTRRQFHAGIRPTSVQEVNNELHSQLDNFHMANLEVKELHDEVESLRKQLADANHTIDEIEVEAEQQYTDMTTEIDELCELVLKKDAEIAALKEKAAKMATDEMKHKEDVEAKKVIIQRQQEIIESLREENDAGEKKLQDVLKEKDKALEELAIARQKDDDKHHFLAKEAQMSLEIDNMQREIDKQKLILNSTSASKVADTFERRILELENAVREREVIIHKQNQIINGSRRSPTSTSTSASSSASTSGRPPKTHSAANLPSTASSSESFQQPISLDLKARETLYNFLLSDRLSQLANIYSIGRILDLSLLEEHCLERHLDRNQYN